LEDGSEFELNIQSMSGNEILFNITFYSLLILIPWACFLIAKPITARFSYPNAKGRFLRLLLASLICFLFFLAYGLVANNTDFSIEILNPLWFLLWPLSSLLSIVFLFCFLLTKKETQFNTPVLRSALCLAANSIIVVVVIILQFFSFAFLSVTAPELSLQEQRSGGTGYITQQLLIVFAEIAIALCISFTVNNKVFKLPLKKNIWFLWAEAILMVTSTILFSLDYINRN
jgi:hypothetical protein